ncbi:MFS transporter [Pararobbsia alpina]|uniref:Sugar efflux transporter B n=1 Tax=Pararobbsia alpina TaxID=621374 RepID=A0A6S7D3J8_9BURK|nr:MFS transporter [Pararobbsia alpina]CAB3805435.1 Sugar efflux transporter B [Pararobbsia alpina]
MNCSLLVVMFGAFVAQTTEYLPIGLLPQIGHSLGVSDGSVGVLVTGYAWLAALTAIPFTLATNRLDRRTLFLGLLAVIAVANLFATVSPSYAMLAGVRIVTALTHGVFWSILAAFATRLVPEMPANRALAWAFGGISLAVVAGVPLATAIGQWAGWRAAFGFFAVLAAIMLLAGMLLLPSVPGQGHEADLGFPHGNVPLYGAALATALIVAAHFCSYTYVVPLLTAVAGVPDPRLSLLLFVFGLAGTAGTIIAGWAGQRPSATALVAAIGIVVSLALMMLAGRRPSAAWLEMALWGGSISALTVGLQGWILKFAPERADAASALYVAAFNIGIGSGAMIGGLSLDRRASTQLN